MSCRLAHRPAARGALPVIRGASIVRQVLAAVLTLGALLAPGCRSPRDAGAEAPSAPAPDAQHARTAEPAPDRAALLASLRSPLAPLRPTTGHDERPIAFVGVTVLPMDGEYALPDHTVVVRNRTIAAVGPRADVTVPVDAHVIHGEGRWLMPGLADMHVHAWSPDHFVLFLANGVTTIRNMFGSPLHLLWRSRIETHQWIGPRLLTAGPILDGDPPVWNGSAVVTTPESAVAVVRAQQAAGYDFIKVYDRLHPDVYAAIVDTAWVLGMPVCGHVPTEVGVEGVLNARQHSIEHLAGFAAALHPRGDLLTSLETWLALGEADATRLPGLAARFREADAWSCPTLVVTTKIVPAAEGEALARAPEMRFVAPATLAMWKPENDFRFASWTAETYDQLRKGDVVRRAAVRALRDAGAGILLGTDAFNPYVVPGFSIHEELRLLVDAGLTPYEALVAGTSAVGRSLDEPRTGIVLAGAPADLLLLDADPFVDVAAVKRLRGVMADGRWFPIEELQARLELVARSYGHEPR